MANDNVVYQFDYAGESIGAYAFLFGTGDLTLMGQCVLAIAQVDLDQDIRVATFELAK